MKNGKILLDYYSVSPLEVFRYYYRFSRYYGKSIGKRLILKNKMMQQSKARDLGAYGEKKWKKILESRYWEKATTLDEFCLTSPPLDKISNEQLNICVIDGKWKKATFAAFQQQTTKKYLDILKKFVSSNDKIAEAGCGFGTKLFSLKAQGLPNEMEGYDISETGVKAGREISNFFNCNIKFDVLDLTAEFPKNIFKDKTVFSSHCFEQLKYHTEKAIYNLIKANPKQVLHFEPVKELFGWSTRDVVSKLYNYAQDLQNNLLKSLRKIEEKGFLEITNVHRTGMAVNPFLETSFIRWIPKSN